MSAEKKRTVSLVKGKVEKDGKVGSGGRSARMGKAGQPFLDLVVCFLGFPCAAPSSLM